MDPVDLTRSPGQFPSFITEVRQVWLLDFGPIAGVRNQGAERNPHTLNEHCGGLTEEHSVATREQTAMDVYLRLKSSLQPPHGGSDILAHARQRAAMGAGEGVESLLLHGLARRGASPFCFTVLGRRTVQTASNSAASPGSD